MKKNKDLLQYTPKLAQNQVKRTPTVIESDLFTTNYGEHPSFEEFKTYCKQHSTLFFAPITFIFLFFYLQYTKYSTCKHQSHINILIPLKFVQNGFNTYRNTKQA